MSFLRNFRNNYIQHQSNKVHYKDVNRKRDDSDDEDRPPSRFDTYTRRNNTNGRKSSNLKETNDKKSKPNYSTLRSENVVRVYLNSPSSPVSDRRRSNKESDEESENRKVTRSDTFTKTDRPTIVRSDTFTLKSETTGKEDENVYEEYENQQSNYSTFTRSNKDSKSRSTDKPGNYRVDSGTYKKDKDRDKGRNNTNKQSVNTNTFTKPAKPKRVESLIKRFERNFLRREKEPSPTPSAQSTESVKNQKSKNIFNLIGGSKVRTRDVGINCKIDDDLDYQRVLTVSTKRMVLKPAISERTLKSARKISQENRDSVKAAERRMSRGLPEVDQHIYENVKKNARQAPIRVEIDLRKGTKYDSDYSESSKPVGIANPQVHRNSNTSVTSTESRRTSNQYQVTQPIRVELPKSKPSPAPRTRKIIEEESFSNRKAPEKMSFREYRESLRAKRERQLTSDPEDDLKKSHQQSFFVAF